MLKKFTMMPIYEYGDHPKGTATVGEIAGSLMHGNPKTKVMRLHNAIQTSPVEAPKPVAIVSGRIGGLSYIYSVSEMIKWRKKHVSLQTTKREMVMNRAIHKAELSKSRSTKTKLIEDQANEATMRYNKYVKMRQHADGMSAKKVIK